MRRAWMPLAAIAVLGVVAATALAGAKTYKGNFPSDENSGMQLKAKLDGNKPKTVTEATWFNTDGDCTNGGSMQQGDGFREKVKVRNREFSFEEDTTNPAGATHIEIYGTFARDGKSVTGTVSMSQGYFMDLLTCTTPPTEFALELD